MLNVKIAEVPDTDVGTVATALSEQLKKQAGVTDIKLGIGTLTISLDKGRKPVVVNIYQIQNFTVVGASLDALKETDFLFRAVKDLGYKTIAQGFYPTGQGRWWLDYTRYGTALPTIIGTTIPGTGGPLIPR